ncbi:TonB-dependent receptor [Pelagicoccus sp. SDUM812002]|uniref:TonB-dependent receptor n=1 Tax=Pelagicoccus sp. SDUM812002 TaxID=3041266 RepID=UPI00280ED37C|nr:TonB-dependent receptor [Pelagicoccus sp. SDUM812002]MDQ8188214.1 TonB-dependent receptor [Pelagicoccus sp. SDUM812002]
MNLPKQLTSLAGVSVLSLLGVNAQAATIEGHVRDDDQSLFIEGANVVIKETGDSVYTERGGRFVLSDLAAGSYTLEMKAQGYPLEVMKVDLNDADDMATANFILRVDVVELEGFTVKGSLIGEAKAQNIQKSSQNLVNAVSSDALGQFVDRNAAEALQRVPGVTVEDSQGEGKFVIIRGADPQLSNIMLDGIEVATPEENGRQTGLNIVTVDQLERLEVSKTWLPNQKGGVIGGTVNLITRSALDRGGRFGSVEAAFTQYDLADDASHRFNLTFGDVLSNKDLPFLGNKMVGVQFSVNMSEDQRATETLSAGWDPSPAPLLQGDPILGYVLNETNFNDFKITRERKGFSGRVELDLAEAHEVYLAFSHNEFDDEETNRESGRGARTGDSNTYAGTRRLTPAIAEQLGLDLSDPFNADRINTIDPTQGSLTYAEAIQLGDIVYDADLKQYTYSRWGGTVSNEFRNILTEDKIFTFQVGGEHTFFDDVDLEWKYYQSDAEQDRVSRGIVLAGSGVQVESLSGGDANRPLIESLSEGAFYDATLFQISEDTAAGPYHNLADSEDKRDGFELNASTSYDFFGFRMKTEVGGSFDFRDKAYNVNNNNYSSPLGAFDDTMYPLNRIRLSDEVFFGGESDSFVENFGENFLYGPTFDVDSTLAFLRDPGSFGAEFGQLPNEINANFTDSVTTDYVATEDIMGGYLMQTIRRGDLQIIAGARYENTENSFENLAIATRTADGQFISPAYWRFLDESVYSNVVETEREYDYWLPAVHVRYDVSDSLVLRASVTETISRPTFTDLVPREVPGISGALFTNVMELPNFELRPWESRNYDFSVEYYFEPLGTASIGIFEKELDGPIYIERRDEIGPNDETAYYAELYNSTGRNVSPYTFTRRVNGGEGELSGIEFSFNRSLNMLPGFLKNMAVDANYATFDSSVELVTFERLGEEVPLFRQPDETANFSLSYETDRFFVRASYNLRGAYLNSVRGGGVIEELELLDEPAYALDTYVGESERLDLIARYQLRDGLNLFFEGTNLTNEPLIQYRGNETRVTSVRYSNPIYTLGVKLNY